MQRLSGFDAGFLYMETPTLHMHTCRLAIVDPSTVPGGYSFERVKEVLAGRLHLVPPFRRRLVTVPFGLGHPLWIEDPSFHLDDHVRRVAVQSPGGPRELAELFSDIVSRPLDRTRPLWEIWVVEGLEHGHLGFVAKIHHAAVDGVSGAELLLNVLDTEPEPAEPASPERPWQPDRVPTRRELVSLSLQEWRRQLHNLPALLRRTLAGLWRVLVRRHEADVTAPMPFTGPVTRFNHALTPRRTFAFTSLALDDVKAVKAAFGVTVNDVVLASCAGALRRYLAERGELPDRPLVAGVPVSTRKPEEKGALGNRVANMFTLLHTDVADPVERLQAIASVSRAAKDQLQALGPEMLQDWSELTPPGLFTLVSRMYSRMRLADHHRPPINLVVSNVPGPPFPLYIAGGKLLAIYSMGPILEGIGLNVTVWSYQGEMNFGVVACRDNVPDLWDLVDGLPDALAELTKAAEARGGVGRG